MKYILCIETATSLCSVSLFADRKLLSLRETTEPNAHSQYLSVFIQKILCEAGIGSNDLSAVAVSNGPGSYTGLRIGLSMAKGLCFGLNIPLVVVPTTEILARACVAESSGADNDLICAMIDARRMEVYHGIYTRQFQLLYPIEPHILTSDSYHDILTENRVHFVGDGVPKASKVIQNPNALFHPQIKISSRYIIEAAIIKLTNNETSNIAYESPFYLKEFLTKPCKSFF